MTASLVKFSEAINSIPWRCLSSSSDKVKYNIIHAQFCIMVFYETAKLAIIELIIKAFLIKYEFF